MGIDITTYRIRIGRFGPGRGNISTGIAEIYSSSTTGWDIQYRMLATMVLLTFLLKCCVMIQQEGIMQDIYTFSVSCQSMAHIAILNQIPNATSNTFLNKPRHDKTCFREFLTTPDTNRPAQPQKLARVLKFRL